MTPEGKIQAAAIAYARKRGVRVRRNHMGRGAETGWPDVEFLPGRSFVFFIEFKAPGGTLRPRQELIISGLLRDGYEVHVSSSIEDARQIIDGWVDRLAKPY